MRKNQQKKWARKIKTFYASVNTSSVEQLVLPSKESNVCALESKIGYESQALLKPSENGELSIERTFAKEQVESRQPRMRSILPVGIRHGDLVSIDQQSCCE